MATLIISNKKMKDIFKIVIYLEDSSLMIKGARETFGNEAKKQRDDVLLGTLHARLFWNLLASIFVHTGDGVIQAAERTILAVP